MDWLIIVGVRMLAQAALSLAVLAYGGAALLGVPDLGGRIVFCLIGIWAVRPDADQLVAYLDYQKRRQEEVKP